jgi:8-oxo-dGTP pyrophosphatase MutT (NUDIX family)
LYELVRLLNNADLSKLTPFELNGYRVGYVRPTLARMLCCEAPACFASDMQERLTFVLPTVGCEELSDRLAHTHAALADRGLLPKPVAETVDVRVSLTAPPLFRANRNLVFPLGLKGRGVHLVIQYADGDYLIAQRSDRVFTYRGCFDVPVGGVLPSDADPWQHAQVEAWEEAGMRPDLLENPSAAAVLTYARTVQGSFAQGAYAPAFPFETDGGTNWDEVFYWHLIVPEDFRPQAIDGEVRRFHRLTPADLLASLANNASSWKTNSGVMLLQCLANDPRIPSEVVDREGLSELLLALSDGAGVGGVDGRGTRLQSC